ncbi:MAG: hypothetical protein B6D64_09875 [Bacteroidetes bacterium 4484_276]|nr:MAG: hypothetical protein B6D64_09875 [Bacteroidetes bacterium 4484_276]
MKKIKLLITAAVVVMLAMSFSEKGVEITFQVDMAEQTVSPLGVHVAGTFQGWDPAATEMTLVQDAIYAITINLTEGEEIEFKYVNGNAWGMEETVPAGCAQNNNRFFTVPGEDTTLDAVCFGSCTVCNPPTVEITFQVDMSNETVSPLGIHIAGSFQGWDPAGTEMLPVGNGVYAVTIDLDEGNYYEYKFINGNAWGMDETVPPECAVSWNRYLTVPSVPTTLDAVCFGSCDPCGPPPIDITVTFNVDMSEQVIVPEGMHIAGGFQGWDPGATLMEDAGDNIYTYTTILPSGTYQEFKYINGITWEQSEEVPPECGINGNRFFVVPMTDTVMTAVCYASCNPCGPPPLDVNVTFQVDMSDEAIATNGVHVTGSFQGWDPAATEMIDMGDDIYAITVVVSSGTYYEFKYVNGDTFDDIEAVPEECGVPDGQGGFNRFFTTPQNDTILPALCFGSCGPCPPPMPEHNVTFRVDMSYEDVSADGIHLAGTFQGWDPASTEMTNAGDDIYEITLALEEEDYHEFKYINGNTIVQAEIIPPECAQNGNRFFNVPAYDTIMTAVCFGSCDPCGQPPVDVNVTFQVDLSNEAVSIDGIHIAGSFQGWDPASTALTLVYDDIYQYSQIFQSGTSLEYKFINGNTFEGAETVPEECGVPDGQGGFNRYLTVPANDTILPVLCFSSCGPCIPPVEVNVTFRADLHWEVISPDGVHVAGNFQGWDPGTTEMQFVSDEFYEYTTVLTAGTEIEYKFVNGDEWGDEEDVPEECGVPDGQGGFNRYFTVPANDTTLPFYCFAQCVDPCYINSVNEKLKDYEDFYPNPASDILYFNEKHALAEVQVYTVNGKLILSKKLDQLQFNIAALKEGFYFVRITNNEGIVTGKLLIK